MASNVLTDTSNGHWGSGLPWEGYIVTTMAASAARNAKHANSSSFHPENEA
jgi:hypothetical protein